MGHSVAHVFISAEEAERLPGRRHLSDELISAAVHRWETEDEGMGYGYSANPARTTPILPPVGRLEEQGIQLYEVGGNSIIVPVIRDEDIKTETKTAKVTLSGETIEKIRSDFPYSSQGPIKEITQKLQEKGISPVSVRVKALPSVRKAKAAKTQGKIVTEYYLFADDWAFKNGEPKECFSSLSEARVAAAKFAEENPKLSWVEIRSRQVRATDTETTPAIVRFERPKVEGTVAVEYVTEKPRTSKPKIAGYAVQFDYHF